MKGCQTPAARLYWIFLALFAALAGSAALVAAQGGRASRAQARGVYPVAAGERPLIGAQTPAVDLRRINPHDPNQMNGTVPGAPSVWSSCTSTTFGMWPTPWRLPRAPPPRS